MSTVTPDPANPNPTPPSYPTPAAARFPNIAVLQPANHPCRRWKVYCQETFDLTPTVTLYKGTDGQWMFFDHVARECVDRADSTCPEGILARLIECCREGGSSEPEQSFKFRTAEDRMRRENRAIEADRKARGQHECVYGEVSDEEWQRIREATESPAPCSSTPSPPSE